jgi:hypothetical protein
VGQLPEAENVISNYDAQAAYKDLLCFIINYMFLMKP